MENESRYEPVEIDALEKVYYLPLEETKEHKKTVSNLNQFVSGNGIGDGSILLAVSKEKDNICVYCFSRQKKCRALEMLDDILEPYGIAKGDADFAQGSISVTLLRALIEEDNSADVNQYFQRRITAYFEHVDEIVAKEYAINNSEEIQKLPLYYKKKIAWSYVKTLDVAPKGTQISIKTLENDTGVKIETDEKRYIMIGRLGEVYDIWREKFERSYDVTDESLDIFSGEMDYIPAIEIVDRQEIVSIDELAHICYPKPESGIYAKELSRKTKIFINDSEEYFIGQAGDFMAIRPDDYTDIYVIQKDIFHRTYEMKGNE